MYNLAIRKCTSSPLLAPRLKIFNLLPRRGSNPGPAESEADMLPSEPARRAEYKKYVPVSLISRMAVRVHWLHAVSAKLR